MSDATTNPPGTRDFEGTAHGARRWIALAILLIPVALTLMSVTSVNVALPAIRDGVDASDAAASLVLTGYALAFGLVLVPAGRWGDQHSHKLVFIAGVLVFVAASAWSGLAGDEVQLVISRLLAGIGAGFALTPVAALIQLLFAGLERARPFAIMGAVFGVSTAVGPLLGGLLVAIGPDLGWRLTFLVNVPVGIAVAVLSVFLIPRDRPSGAPRGDAFGLLLLIAGVALLLLPFTIGRGLDVTGILLLLGGVALLVAFALWERSRSRRGLVSIVPSRMFAHRSFPIGVATMFLGFASFTASFLVLALLWQDGLGHSALESGLLILPYAIGSIVAGGLSDRVWHRIGRHTVTVGLAAITLGLAVVGVLLATVTADALSSWILAAPLLLTGIGSGLFVGPNTNAAVTSIDRQDAGVASGLLGTAQRAGTALGIGLVAAVLAAAVEGPGYLASASASAFVTAGFALAALVVASFSDTKVERR
ncbi:MFS transporter [Microbacterium sp. NPDC077663]|uniref:MFS transporter n=1 Tax=Microbacterium sp. NPDC077663 TaxID=3364189 RepID=UPI0037CA0F79